MRQHHPAETLSQSPVEAPSPTSPSSMTSTLALLPSSPIHSPYGKPFAAGLPFPQQYSPNNDTAIRPKLTLNTSSCSRRRLGKGNTGLRLDKLSANSPTVQNTFKNGYDTQHHHHHPATPATLRDPSSGSSASRSSATSSSSPGPSTPHPSFASPSSSATSISDRSSCSSRPSSSGSKPGTPPSTNTVPYTHTPSLHSILSNTPLPGLAPAVTARQRKPSRRGVAFRSTLTEVIQTNKYTARHSDLLEDEEEPIARSPSSSEPPLAVKPDGPRQEDTSETDSGDDTDLSLETCPKTPVSGRRKRRRDWKWTLGPLEGVECRTPDTPDPEPDISLTDKNVPNPTSAPTIAVPIPRKRLAK